MSKTLNEVKGGVTSSVGQDPPALSIRSERSDAVLPIRKSIKDGRTTTLQKIRVFERVLPFDFLI